MSEEFLQVHREVRAHRAELRALVDALSGPIARGGAWRERVRAALAELAHDFEDHILLTERPGGIYDGVRTSDPRLAAKVTRLTGEHVLLRDDISGYLTVLFSTAARWPTCPPSVRS